MFILYNLGFFQSVEIKRKNKQLINSLKNPYCKHIRDFCDILISSIIYCMICIYLRIFTQLIGPTRKCNLDGQTEIRESCCNFTFHINNISDQKYYTIQRNLSCYVSGWCRSLCKFLEYFAYPHGFYEWTCSATAAKGIRKKIRRQFYFYFDRHKGQIQQHYNGKNF